MAAATPGAASRLALSIAITVAAVHWPGVGEWISLLGGQAEVSAIVLGAWALVHGALERLAARRGVSRVIHCGMPARFPLTHTAAGPFRTVINDANGDTIGEIKGAVFAFELWDDRPRVGGKVGVYSSWDAAWEQAVFHFGRV